MAVELASAYISLVPSARGLQQQLAGELTGPLEQEGRRAGDAASSAFGGRFVPAMAAVAAAGAAAVGGALAGLAAVGGAFDDAFDTIRVGTGATGDALSSLQDDFRAVVASVPTDFGSASQAIADLNTRLGLTGQPLQDISAQMLELSRITGTDLGGNIESTTRLLGDWGVANEEAADALDLVFRASQATGPSVEQLSRLMVQFGAPMRQLGFTFEESAALLGSFQQAGVNTELVMGSMRQALGRMAREGEPAVETFQRVSEEIANAGSASEANALAIELFGARAGPDMASAIREGRFEISELVDTITNSSETILGAAADTNDFAESWTLLKNRLMLVIEPAATAVFNAIGTAMDWLTDVVETHLVPAFQRLSGWWASNGPAIITAAQNVAAMISGAFDTIANAVTGAIDWFRGIFGGEGAASQEMSAFAERVSGWGEQLLGIFQSAWDAITAAVDVALAVVQGLWERFGDDILRFLQGTWENIQSVIDAALNVIQGIFETFAGLFTGDWSRMWDGIKQIFEGLWNAVVAFFQQILNTIQGIFSIAAQQLSGAWTSFTAFLRNTWETVWNAIRNFFTTIWNALRGAIDAATAALRAAWENFTGFLRNTWQAVWDAHVTIFNTVWGALRGAWDTATGALRTAWDTFTGGIRAVWDGLWSGITTAFSTVRSGLEGAFRGLVDTLGAIWDGVRNTLAAPINWVAEHVINGLVGAVNRVSNALGAGDILSPLQVPLIPTFHEGGVVGAGGRMTPLSQLTADELLIKVRKGEEVVTTDDPRHMANLKPWVPPTGGDPASPSTQIGGGGGVPAFRSIGSMVSNIGGFIKDAAYGVLSAARELIANTIRPLIEGIANMAASAVEQFGPPGRIVAGAGRVLVDKVLDWIAGVDDDVDKAINASGFGRGLEWARSQAGKPYIWGGVGPEGYDCSGFLSALTNVILGRGPHKRLFTSASIIDSAGGQYFRPGRDGEFVIGARKGNPGHVAGTLLGTNVESAGRVGVRVGGPTGGSYGTHGFTFAGTFDRGGVLAPGLNVVDNKTGGLEALRPVGDTPDMDYWAAVGRQIARASAAQQRIEQRKVRS